jgi:hypothetical protein
MRHKSQNMASVSSRARLLQMKDFSGHLADPPKSDLASSAPQKYPPPHSEQDNPDVSVEASIINCGGA